MSNSAEIAIQVGIGLLVAVLAFLLGLLKSRLWAAYRFRHAKHFWRPITRSSPTVVVGTHRFPDWEPSGLMGVGDAKAIDELREHFGSLHLPAFEVKFADELPRGQAFDGTLIWLGGPDTNEAGIASRLWLEAGTSFVWRQQDPHDVAIRDLVSGKVFGPDGFHKDTITRDYALIVRVPNPFAPPSTKSWALLFAGCLGFGTLGAVQYARRDEFVMNPNVARGKAVECLLSVQVENGAPQRTDLVEARAI